MSTKVGSIKGTLRLQVGGADLNLGTVTIPLSANTLPRTDSGSEEIAIGITCDLEEMRRVIQELFSQEAE